MVLTLAVSVSEYVDFSIFPGLLGDDKSTDMLGQYGEVHVPHIAFTVFDLNGFLERSPASQFGIKY